MTGGLLYGQGVLDLFSQLPAVDKTVLLIRHSERPSFDNIPVGEWNKVLLTPQGKEAAKDFGRALAQNAGVEGLRVYSWGLRRCAETAEAIASGAKEEGCRTSPPEPIRLRSPVADREKYDTVLQRGGYERLLDEWLGKGTGRSAPAEAVMVPVDEYAPEIFRGLLEDGVCGRHGTSVVVTHDLHIIPLARRVFGPEASMPGFLEGVVVKAGPQTTHIGYGKMHRPVEYAQLVGR